MKLINITDKHQRTVWLRAFHIWQCRPHKVAPLPDTVSVCASCGTKFLGNFCPRCGQSASIGRFSFKKALLLFLDVWGIGNRGMFRSIRDLMLRPGYMIRDYLSGMQSAYFPPFKMFFLLTAFSLVVQHGFTLDIGKEETQRVEQKMDANADSALADEFPLDFSDSEKEVHEKRIVNTIKRVAFAMDSIREKSPAIFALLSLVLFALPLYLFIRSSPVIPSLRFSEFIVSLVYTANVYTIFVIAGTLLYLDLIKLIAILMIFVTFHQLTGFSKRRMLGYVILTILISSVTLLVIAGTVGYLTYLATS